MRIFEATGADIGDLGEEQVTASFACAARAARSSWSRCLLPSAGPSTAPSQAGCAATRKNLDRHPNYILAAYMASGT